MSKFEKLLQKIKKLDKNLRFEEIKKVLEAYGYKMESPGSGSSHYSFRKEDVNLITIPRHKPINRVYVALVKEAIEKEDANENA